MLLFKNSFHDMLIYRVHIAIVLGKSTFSAFQIGKQTKSDDLAFIGFFYWGFSIPVLPLPA